MPHLGGSVKSQVSEASPAEIILHDGHQLGHLTEQQYSVVGVLQLGQDAVEQFKLARHSVQVWAAIQA